MFLGLLIKVKHPRVPSPPSFHQLLDSILNVNGVINSPCSLFGIHIMIRIESDTRLFRLGSLRTSSPSRRGVTPPSIIRTTTFETREDLVGPALLEGWCESKDLFFSRSPGERGFKINLGWGVVS